MPSFFLALLVFFTVVLATGCSTVGPHARRAAMDPWTWVPLVGAAVVEVTDSDQRISDWAKTHTPVYGSREDALRASDRYRNIATNTSWAALAAARPSREGHWFAGKAIDATASLAGVMLARNTTGYLKGATDRERPNGSVVHDSFPSAHATDAFARATMGRFHAERLALPGPAREGVKWVMNASAIATAWGRVEGGVHYPTDVLVGAAIANFSTHLLLSPLENGWRVAPITDGDSVVLLFQKPF